MADVLNAYPQHGFKADDIAATPITCGCRRSYAGRLSAASGRSIPASVVKMFYMAALERQLQDGKVTMTPETGTRLHRHDRRFVERGDAIYSGCS